MTKKMSKQGIVGESIESWIVAQFSIKRKPRNVVREQIDILPNIIKILPSPLTIVNFDECFKINTNAFIAEGQKFSEVRAI